MSAVNNEFAVEGEDNNTGEIDSTFQLFTGGGRQTAGRGRETEAEDKKRERERVGKKGVKGKMVQAEGACEGRRRKGKKRKAEMGIQHERTHVRKIEDIPKHGRNKIYKNGKK